MKKSKLIALCVLALFLVSALAVGCGSSTPAPAAKKEIILKAADNQPDDYPTVMALKQMAKLLDERTQGRIKCRFIPVRNWAARKKLLK
jgi:TRAP-type C4-dicarboxylate transport system substrate-binding protein